jgi:acetone carboxylase gamma subunit
MRVRVSESLFAERGQVCCASCLHALAPVGQSWKKAAAVSTVGVLRRFSCPRCGYLLDTEVALPEDPFLEDVVALA